MAELVDVGLAVPGVDKVMADVSFCEVTDGWTDEEDLVKAEVEVGLAEACEPLVGDADPEVGDVEEASFVLEADEGASVVVVVVTSELC